FSFTERGDLNGGGTTSERTMGGPTDRGPPGGGAPPPPPGAGVGAAPPPAAAGTTAGTLPSGFGERFVTVVTFDTIGAGRKFGGTWVRRPQNLSLMRLAALSFAMRAFCDSRRMLPGGEEVVEKPRRPPVTSLVSETPTLVPAARRPSK